MIKNETQKKKLEKLKNSTITATKTENDNQVIIDIYVSENIEPSMRHRDRSDGGKYDPLNYYKKYLRKTVMEQLDIPEPYEGEFHAYIKYYRTCTEDSSEYFKLKAYAHEIKPLKKPDNDNVIKTIQDTFNKYIFVDDIQVSKVVMEKFYSPTNSTYIRFVLNKEHQQEIDSIKGKKVNKKIREEYKNKIDNIKEGF